MNIVFLSNFYNHHQAFVSQKLYELTNGNYRFIATTEMPEERRRLGYVDLTDPFVSFGGDAGVSSETIQRWVDSADIVIVGSAPEQLLANRKKSQKIIFRYSERPLKNGNQLGKYPLRWYKWHRKNPREVPIYMLCASAYTAPDYAKFGLFKGKSYKWGYFPKCKRYEDVDVLMARKDPHEILWCGRFLDWKHPDDVLAVAKRLKNANVQFHIHIIGTGEMEDELNRLIIRDELTDVVFLLGSMPSEKVREHMERAGIYLFTSDRKEGWGAVVNEAMNSGCAVVAGDEAGSTRYLIHHHKNGLIYPSCQVDSLYEHVKYLLDHPEEQARLGYAAYKTITTEWNAGVAAERLIALADRILKGEKAPDLYEDGPCSRA